jgi:ATP phosphoribosyltransferase
MAADILRFALPSKGRLQEQVSAWLDDAGLKLVAGARDYRGTIAGEPGVEIKLMSSAEIAGALAAGDVHFGITGEDLIRENIPDTDRSVALLQALGFGFADVVVAVPRAWIDVSTMADLDDVCTAFHARHRRRLRVATKYLALTRNFFAAHGIADYRIVESLGATEGAPAAGVAEAVVDITTTGATLAANGLKVLDDGVVLKSQAQLAAALNACWNGAALESAGRICARIAARELARNSYLLRGAFPEPGDSIAAELTRAGFSPIAAKDGTQSLLCHGDELTRAVALLRQHDVRGAIAAERVEYVFDEKNLPFARLTAALGR